MTQYKIIFDNGKPYEVIVNSQEELEKELRSFYNLNHAFYDILDAHVYDDQDQDISETQLITEMVSDILYQHEEEVFG